MLKALKNTATSLAQEPQDLPLDQVLIEGLILPAFIGMFAHEYDAPQPIRFDVSVDISPLSSAHDHDTDNICLLYTSPSPRDRTRSRMPSSA